MPPSKIFQGYIVLDVAFSALYRFGLARAQDCQKVFFCISMERSAAKGNRGRSRWQVPENMFVSLAAFTSLPSMFSLPVHWNFRHFDCLSAEVISPLLLFREASVWQILVVAIRCWRVFPSTPVNAHCFACLSAGSSFVLLLLHEAAFWQSTTVSTGTKFGKLWGEF